MLLWFLAVCGSPPNGRACVLLIAACPACSLSRTHPFVEVLLGVLSFVVTSSVAADVAEDEDRPDTLAWEWTKERLLGWMQSDTWHPAKEVEARAVEPKVLRRLSNERLRVGLEKRVNPVAHIIFIVSPARPT